MQWRPAATTCSCAHCGNLARQLLNWQVRLSCSACFAASRQICVWTCSLWLDPGLRVGRASAEAAAAGAEAEQGEVGGGARARAQGSCDRQPHARLVGKPRPRRCPPRWHAPPSGLQVVSAGHDCACVSRITCADLFVCCVGALCFAGATARLCILLECANIGECAGVVFSCTKGTVDLETPIALVQDGGTIRFVSDWNQTQHDLVRQLQPMALSQWWQPNHVNWGLLEWDSEVYKQTGTLVQAHVANLDAVEPSQLLRHGGVAALPPAQQPLQRCAGNDLTDGTQAHSAAQVSPAGAGMGRGAATPGCAAPALPHAVGSRPQRVELPGMLARGMDSISPRSHYANEHARAQLTSSMEKALLTRGYFACIHLCDHIKSCTCAVGRDSLCGDQSYQHAVSLAGLQTRQGGGDVGSDNAPAAPSSGGMAGGLHLQQLRSDDMLEMMPGTTYANVGLQMRLLPSVLTAPIQYRRMAVHNIAMCDLAH